MSNRASSTRTEKELNRLETSGEPFTLVDIASKLNLTSRELSKFIQARGNAVCIDRPTGRITGTNYCRYQFRAVKA